MWWLEMLMGDQRQQVSVDRLDAHVPSLILRRAVSSQVGDDEPVVVLECVSHFRPVVGTRSGCTVHTEHRGTGPSNLVVEI